MPYRGGDAGRRVAAWLRARLDGMSSFAANRAALLGAGFRVICMDLPGWGHSDAIVCTEDRSSLNARSLHAVLNAAAVTSPVHLMGASMGAHSAAAFALQWPDRLGKLILVSGGTGGRSNYHADRPEGVRAMLACYQSPTALNMRRFLETVPFDSASITDDAVDAWMRAAHASPLHLENFRQSFEQFPQQFSDVSHRLKDIRASTLVVWGTEDRFVPLDIGLQIALRIPGADLHVMARTGHIPHIERASDFNRLVVSFLAD